MSAFDPKQTLARPCLTRMDRHSSLALNVEQDPFLFPFWVMFAAAFAWVALIYGVSIVVRRAKGKPIFPKVPAGALYADKWASGRWASNCLIVSVTDKAVSVVPKFPFNMGFLPEIYGLERTIPVASVREVRCLRSFGLFNNVAVVYDDGVQRELRLKVRNPQAFFLDAVGRSSLVRVSN